MRVDLQAQTLISAASIEVRGCDKNRGFHPARCVSETRPWTNHPRQLIRGRILSKLTAEATHTAARNNPNGHFP